MPNKQQKFYTTKEASTILGVAVSTIQSWTDNGYLHAWTTGGGHRRIACDSVEEILSAQKGLLTNTSAGEQFSVVIVDDNAQQCRMYIKQFDACSIDARVVIAKDGYSGLLKIGQELPDIIITDLKMPNVDGFEMIKALDKTPALKHSLIIVVSGLTEFEIAAKGGLPKDVYFLTKPILFENIESLIRIKIDSGFKASRNLACNA